MNFSSALFLFYLTESQFRKANHSSLKILTEIQVFYNQLLKAINVRSPEEREKLHTSHQTLREGWRTDTFVGSQN